MFLELLIDEYDEESVATMVPKAKILDFVGRQSPSNIGAGEGYIYGIKEEYEIKEGSSARSVVCRYPIEECDGILAGKIVHLGVEITHKELVAQRTVEAETRNHRDLPFPFFPEKWPVLYCQTTGAYKYVSTIKNAK